ncbi:MAG: hypothetical protein A2V64_04690 [Bacteroidetes bacterium RBG_13_43_22]|nr:MAG: hypothetical protein A2V64_04690 [Bacteroidetes bacterium RBG_13_43_22]
MDLRSFKYYPSLLLIVLLVACEREVDTVKLPEFNPMLVIASFISPSDSESFIFVSTNRRLYGELNQDEQPGNLTGTISDGSNEISLDTVSNGLIFSRDKMQIQYGNTYTLKITNDKGLSAEASCTVPEKRDFDLSIDTCFSEQHLVQYGDSLYHFYYTTEFTLSFTDTPAEDNYYRIKGEISTCRTDENTGKINWYKQDIPLGKEYFTDDGKDGIRFILEISTNASSGTGADSSFLKVFLFNTERSYYLYHRSLEDYNSDENPFSEVTPVFSNIKGGLGIFTSYTIDSVVYKIK